MSALVLAIPSKGRLKEQAEAFFADCGLALHADARGYAATIPGAPDVAVRLLSSAEIATALRDGEAHAGVAGEDLLREAEPALSRTALLLPLGFGRADLVVAVPQSWVDVGALADLDAVCQAMRARTGARLRVATKYMALTRAYFEAHGLHDYRIVESLGATEGAPRAGVAEVIVDITTTGATLAANHLKILADGVILRSEAHLAASRAAAWTSRARAALEVLVGAIAARQRARAHRVLRVSCEPAALAAVRAAAVALGCQPEDARDGLTILCEGAKLARMGAALLRAGAGAVTADAPDFVFSGRNLALTRLYESIDKKP